LRNPLITISNDVGRVKSDLIFIFLARAHLFVGAVALCVLSCPFLSSLLTRPIVLLHQLGVAHQPSLRSLGTMMMYSNSSRDSGRRVAYSLTRSLLLDHW
jgi:hypothetical protein